MASDHSIVEHSRGSTCDCGLPATSALQFCGYINTVCFTFDPAKSARNVTERGLAFDLAEEFDWSTALIAEDTRMAYPERRYQALGLIEEHLHMLVFTPRDGAVHVISLRRANQRERTRYSTKQAQS